MDREAWCAAVHRFAKSWTHLANWTTTTMSSLEKWGNFSFRWIMDRLGNYTVIKLCLLKHQDKGYYKSWYHFFFQLNISQAGHGNSFWFLKYPHLYCFSSVQFSHSVVSDSLRPHELQHARPSCPSPTPGVHSNRRPSSWWCHPAISSSGILFSSCPQSLPVKESFPMS